jgi:hypothetical protein
MLQYSPRWTSFIVSFPQVADLFDAIPAHPLIVKELSGPQACSGHENTSDHVVVAPDIPGSASFIALGAR